MSKNPIPPPTGPWGLAVVSSTDDSSERFAILDGNRPIMRTEGDSCEDASNALLATAAPVMLRALYLSQEELERVAVASGERSSALVAVEEAIEVAVWSSIPEVVIETN